MVVRDTSPLNCSPGRPPPTNQNFHLSFFVHQIKGDKKAKVTQERDAVANQTDNSRADTDSFLLYRRKDGLQSCRIRRAHQHHVH